MKLPLSWLREYVDFDLTPKQLADRLTFSGTEVEGIETLGGEFKGVIVGEVLTVDKHPNADRLTVCRVNDGAGELTVVCGAPNVRAGIKVPLATIGTVLPGGLTIKKAKVRGVESFGMLCAADELGLSKDHSGLMLLPETARAGQALSEILGPPETILKLEVTPNRPDCLSVIGMAREIAALLGVPFRLPPAVLPGNSGEPVDRLTAVTVEDPVGCPRYTARLLSGITIGPSPEWMQHRLTCAGIRPINNVVDITNYVMLECGQPLHAFDFELLQGRRIVVRRPRAGEVIQTLDGQPRAIDPDMLVIADANRPVAVAGVMGGAGSEIRDTTRTVLLESALFKSQDIRRTSKRLGLSTESSYRFERGVDVGVVEWASRRAAALMAAHAGATVAPGAIDAWPTPPVERRVGMRYGRARDLLGIDLDNAGMDRILRSLGFTVVGREADCDVTVPTFRVDIDQEADLIEEVARVHGLDKIPTPAPSARLVPGADDRPTRSLLACRAALTGLGLTEIVSYSFMADRLLSFIGYGAPERRLVLPNPVSADFAVLRDSLIPQMIETLGRNRSRQAREAGLFELGRVFGTQAEGGQTEEDRLCVGLMGPVGRSGLGKAQTVEPDDLFQWLKGVLESLCRALHVRGSPKGGLTRPDITFEESAAGCFEAGRAVSVIIAGEPAGVLGLVSERIRAEWRVTDPLGVLELRLAPLLGNVLGVPAVRPIAPYPGVERDVAMVVADATAHDAVVACMWQAAPPELVDVRLFDVYRGKGLGEGRKSLAYSLTYRSMDRTLTDEAANAMHDRVKAALRRDLQAEIRES